MIAASDLPTLNAVLNGTCTLVLATGYAFIRRKHVTAHRACMITACVLSALFLISYVAYHRMAGFTRFTGEGWIRTAYFSILIPHTILAALALPPMVLITLRRALRGNFARHRRMARWTLPVWLYVSVTGVLVYWMLYHL
jgi:uncharacterized membrane protein YozB (DUF420 family)